ncbi:MAG: DUF5758 domain-containing protein [Bulleidia sp.]
MNQRKIDEIVERHQHWLNEDCENWESMRACFRNCNLIYAKFEDVNLKLAIFDYADLQKATFNNVNLQSARFYNANLEDIFFGNSILRYADLNQSDLRGATFYESDLYKASLANVKTNEMTEIFFPLACPDTGEFIGWKKARGKIICLKIPKSAKRSSATSRKCRCSEAKVISIQNPDGTDSGLKQVRSNHDPFFVYEIGKTVKVNDFCEDRWKECAPGIHFFITREEAVNY